MEAWLARYEEGRWTAAHRRAHVEVREHLADRWARGRYMVDVAEREFARLFFRVVDLRDGARLEVFRDGEWTFGGQWGVREGTLEVSAAHHAAERKMWESVKHCLRVYAAGGDSVR